MTPGALLSLAVLLAGSRPWLAPRANSEQRQPVYLGLTPLELELGAEGRGAVLPAALKESGEAVFAAQLSSMGVAAAQFEAWPVYDELGRVVWAAARWRAAEGEPWRWLSGGAGVPEGSLLLPRTLRLDDPAEREAVFLSSPAAAGLYDKPVAGDCLWTDAQERLLGGWGDPPVEARACRAVAQPAFVDGAPRTFVVEVDASGVRWPADAVFSDPPAAGAVDADPVLDWPKGFPAAFLKDVRWLAGFERKNSAQPDHQLGALLDRLEARYKAMGLRTWRDRFEWRGIPQENLFAAVGGSLAGPENRPVVLADHVDTAFAEDAFNTGAGRVSVPGADDNASGTAALLQAADVLRGTRPRHDIWFAHLTGEEFPADDLGARRLVWGLLKEKRRLGGILLLDMIAYRDPGDPVFQVNAGGGAESERLAAAAMSLAERTAGAFKPVLRPRFDPESYLYNTDGLIFDQAGFPVVLFNEHLNYKHNLERRHYHETSDTVDKLDPALAEAVARTAAETAAWLAGAPGPTLPAGALPLPLVRQATPYSCGAAAMQSVFLYWGVYDGGEAGLYERLGTRENDGTDPRGMAAAARAMGLRAELLEGMSVADLRARLAKGETVVLDIQAWGDPGTDPTPEDWSDNDEDGHYVVLAGLDAKNAYVMDPSVAGAYGWFPLAELETRWHDYEDRGGTVWRNRGLGIAVSGDSPAPSFPAPLRRVR